MGDVQRHFSSRDDTALLQDYNVSFVYCRPAGGSAADTKITTPSSALTEAPGGNVRMCN